MLLLIALRMPVGLSMLVVGSVGFIHLSSWSAFFAYMKTNSYHQFANYTLSVIPLFILMGALAERSGISTSLFRAAEAFAGRLRGGLAMAVIWACTAFGAICGSSVATTATFGRAALPELQRYKYDGGFATGTIAVGGTLGILIPPSVILVVYAITTEQNIAKLFKAALIPGLMAALFYCLAIAWIVRRRPEVAPQALGRTSATGCRLLAGLAGAADRADGGGRHLRRRLHADRGRRRSAPSPCCWSASLQRSLDCARHHRQPEADGRDHRHDLHHPAGLGGVQRLPRPLAVARPQAAEWVTGLGLPPYVVIISLLAVYILLGAVMDELAMLLLTLPVFFPIVQALDFGLPADEVAIWFGILVLIVVGIGLTAPPIGLNVFVISSIAKTVPIASTYRGVLPFIVTDIVRLGLVVAFPGLALWLVRLLN